MEQTRRLHRLYAAAVIAIWIEAVLGLLWLTRRRTDGELDGGDSSPC